MLSPAKIPDVLNLALSTSFTVLLLSQIRGSSSGESISPPCLQRLNLEEEEPATPVLWVNKLGIAPANAQHGSQFDDIGTCLENATVALNQN